MPYFVIENKIKLENLNFYSILLSYSNGATVKLKLLECDLEIKDSNHENNILLYIKSSQRTKNDNY